MKATETVVYNAANSPSEGILMPMTAHDFGKPMKTGAVDGRVFVFGGDRERIAARLEQLAAAVRLGADHRDGVAVQKITVSSATAVDDFCTTTLTFEFAEKIEG